MLLNSKGSSNFANRPQSGGTAVPREKLESYTCMLISCGQYYEAYLVLNSLPQQERTISALYNLALCYYHCGAPAAAIQPLEEALAICAGLPSNSSSPGSEAAAMLDHDRQSSAYLNPMGEYAPQIDTRHTRSRMLRLLVDLYAACKLWPSLLAAAAKLEAGRYRNVAEALTIYRKEEEK